METLPARMAFLDHFDDDRGLLDTLRTEPSATAHFHSAEGAVLGTDRNDDSARSAGLSPTISVFSKMLLVGRHAISLCSQVPSASSYLVALFDPVKSPRRWCLVSLKPT